MSVSTTQTITDEEAKQTNSSTSGKRGAVDDHSVEKKRSRAAPSGDVDAELTGNDQLCDATITDEEAKQTNSSMSGKRGTVDDHSVEKKRSRTYREAERHERDLIKTCILPIDQLPLASVCESVATYKGKMLCMQCEGDVQFQFHRNKGKVVKQCMSCSEELIPFNAWDMYNQQLLDTEHAKHRQSSEGEATAMWVLRREVEQRERDFISRTVQCKGQLPSASVANEVATYEGDSMRCKQCKSSVHVRCDRDQGVAVFTCKSCPKPKQEEKYTVWTVCDPLSGKTGEAPARLAATLWRSVHTCTDTNIAMLVVLQANGRLHYDCDQNLWYVYKENHWTRFKEIRRFVQDAVVGAAEAYLRSYTGEATDYSDKVAGLIVLVGNKLVTRVLSALPLCNVSPFDLKWECTPTYLPVLGGTVLSIESDGRSGPCTVPSDPASPCNRLAANAVYVEEPELSALLEELLAVCNASELSLLLGALLLNQSLDLSKVMEMVAPDASGLVREVLCAVLKDVFSVSIPPIRSLTTIQEMAMCQGLIDSLLGTAANDDRVVRPTILNMAVSGARLWLSTKASAQFTEEATHTTTGKVLSDSYVQLLDSFVNERCVLGHHTCASRCCVLMATFFQELTKFGVNKMQKERTQDLSEEDFQQQVAAFKKQMGNSLHKSRLKNHLIRVHELKVSKGGSGSSVDRGKYLFKGIRLKE